MTKKITYTQAFEELQAIVAEMENAEIDIDLLDTRIKRAVELLKICKDKLYKTEKNVQNALEDIENYSAKNPK